MTNDETPEEETPDVETEDAGDGPSSHETSGTFPAEEVAATHPDRGDDDEDSGDGPSSHETSGASPAEEVAATHADAAALQDDRNRVNVEQRAAEHPDPTSSQ